MIRRFPRWGWLFIILLGIGPAPEVLAGQWKVVYGEDGFFVWTDYAIDDETVKESGGWVEFRMREIKKVSRNSLEPVNSHEHHVRIDCQKRMATVLESTSTSEALRVGQEVRVDYFPGEKIADYVCD